MQGLGLRLQRRTTYAVSPTDPAVVDTDRATPLITRKAIDSLPLISCDRAHKETLIGLRTSPLGKERLFITCRDGIFDCVYSLLDENPQLFQ